MADFVLNKGFPVLATYNGSSTNGVTQYRVVKWSSTAIDLQTTAGGLGLGVVLENIDAAKVATGKVNANVGVMGVVPVVCTTGTSVVVGGEVEVTTDGGVINASGTAGRYTLGMVVGMTTLGGTVGNGDVIYVLIQPRKQ